MTHRVIFSAALAVALAGSQMSQAAHLDNPNLLANSGFEDPGLIDNGPGPFTGRWQTFSLDGDEAAGGDTAQYDTTMPRTDAAALKITIDSVANSFSGAFQDVLFPSSLGGTDAWFSGWHKLVGDAGGSEIRIEWRDSATDTEVSRTPNLITSPAGSDYEEFIVAAPIPVGADTARLTYAIQSFGGPLVQTVFVDDVNFNIAGVPEPTTALLALLGLAPMARRRR